jgi:hypothetical protein
LEYVLSKILFVSSPVQAALMTQVFIPELINGFWKNHRPAGHGDVWRDVQVQVSPDGTLGPVGFAAPRNYNFLNLDFALPNEARLVAIAQAVKPNSNFKSIKKELIELGRIVGARLVNEGAVPVKLYRGNHRPGTETVSSSKARMASGSLTIAATKPLKTKPAVKKTVVRTPSNDGVVIKKTASGATVRRVSATLVAAPVMSGSPFTNVN